MLGESSEEQSSQYLELLTYAMMAFTFLAYVLLSQSGFSNQSDALILGLGTLLISYTVLLSLIRSGLIESLEFSATGIKAKFFRRIRAYERSVEPEVAIGPAKSAIDRIRVSETDKGMMFFQLIGEIEKELRSVAVKHNIAAPEKAAPRSIVDMLEEKEILSKPMANAALEYLNIRNRLVHGKVRLTDENIEDALSIGTRLLSDIRRISSSRP